LSEKREKYLTVELKATKSVATEIDLANLELQQSVQDLEAQLLMIEGKISLKIGISREAKQKKSQQEGI
jgi:hypothetical protein